MTTLDTIERRRWLKSGDFSKLFNDIGWDNFSTRLLIPVGMETFALSPVAQKRGVQVFACVSDKDGKLPDYPTRQKIEREVAKSAAEHLLIFADAGRKTQVWQWAAREPNRPVQVREATLYPNQSGQDLLQRLERVTFTISDEESLTLVGVTARLKDAFYRDKVTKKFYERFEKTEHPAFFKLIAGISDDADRRWYTSVMINRIMFLYFIQSKGFLDGDSRYLQNRLKKSAGNDNFYRGFLVPLFFEGLAKRKAERDSQIRAALGELPYLSGSLFVEHSVEAAYPKLIDIPDTAFEKLFAFFDSWNWHLDDRPLAEGDNINPDVLGYIFEKYINQKQMGAYYTKEDITEYIGKNTILPFVLSRAQERCAVAFSGEGSVWNLLVSHPDRYIYPAVRHGVELPLPDDIQAGVSDVEKRGGWNRPAPPEFALPTEIWRETVARRQRYEDVRGKLAAGEVVTVADLITLNLDIRQFAQDVVERCEGANLLSAFWQALNDVSVLDPTCGSGAFLFAALEILKPLYEACLTRMQGFVDDADRLNRPSEHRSFRVILNDIQSHPNAEYFTLKKIITRNLFGVDIMDEAVEICKLRLFLTLAASVEPDPTKDNLGIEPLPDIDFNIRAGNTLVGFATSAQTEAAFSGGPQRRMTDEAEESAWAKFQNSLKVCDTLFTQFLAMQERGDFSSAFAASQKSGLRAALTPLREQADTLLSFQYGAIGKEKFAAWRKSHKPFHWFVEFYRVMKSGGFDVIIGNPPYVEYTKKDPKTKKSIADQYNLKGYETLTCGNLYAFVLERCLDLENPKSYGGMIVPSSAFSTERMKPLVKEFMNTRVWYSFYDFRPSKLFDGVNLRLSVAIWNQNKTFQSFASTYNRWYSEEREYLFKEELHYALSPIRKELTTKVGSQIEEQIFSKVEKQNLLLATLERSGKNKLYFHDAILYWIRATDFAPIHDDYISSHVKVLTFDSADICDIACCLMNSTLFYWWWVKVSNCRDLNVDDAGQFRLPKSLIDESEDLIGLHDALMIDMKAKSKPKVRIQKQTGEVNYREFYPVLSKPIIDEIDRVLAKHYGFTAEELDFIINYDIKYRMGKGAGGGSEEGGEE